MSGNGHVEQDAGFELPPELNPGAVEEEGDTGSGGSEGESSEAQTRKKKEYKRREEEITKWEQEEIKKTNTAPIYFTPQAYFECTGLAPAGSSPNASC